MSAPKPARLTSALLTRKGMALPSATPATRANMVEFAPPTVPRPAAVPPPPARHEPHRPVTDLVDWIAAKMGGAAAAERASHAARCSNKRVRVSLRLDAERHVRLKLAATYLNRTLQSVFTQAMDEFFERHAPVAPDAVTLLRMRQPGNTGTAGPRRRGGDERDGEP